MSSPRKRTSAAASLLIALGCAFAALLGIVWPHDARSQEHNFAGSLQANYMYVPTEKHGRDLSLDGMSTELSLKVAVDFTDNISANVKFCYSCHGVELGMAFVDIRMFDELNVRIGRFNPGFGDFSLRHDPANAHTVIAIARGGGDDGLSARHIARPCLGQRQPGMKLDAK